MLPKVARWDGIEVFEAALASRQGVIMIVPHLGSWEMYGQAVGERFVDAHGPLTALFRPARKKWMAEVLAGSRDRKGLQTLPTTVKGVRGLMRTLKQGGYTGILPDQVPPEGLGVWSPFFGREAYTMTLSARLAQAGRVQILLSWGERLRWGRGYRVHVRPFEPLNGGSLADDPLEAAKQINRAMEALVRECPPQYLWSYDRYKAPRRAAAPPP